MARMAGWQAEFLERVAALSDSNGLPPSFNRVFAWLIVCEPAEQSVEQLRATLRLSAGAISGATATLIRVGYVERVTVPGQRRLYYRIRPDAWEQTMRHRLEAATYIRISADKALAHVAEPHPRLTQMRDVLAWFEDRLSEWNSPEPSPPRPVS